jgi:holliday junction DNA helicase RuvA
MILKLKGTYLASFPTGIVIDVNGVGYRLEMPLSALCDLPQIGSILDLWVYTYVREDALKLFGFINYVDRLAFEILLSLNGVGPKVSLAIMSTLTIENLKQAILQENREILEMVPGIGPRLAEKILVELKPKLKKLNAAREMGFEQKGLKKSAALSDNQASLVQNSDEPEYSSVLEDVRSALENLGFREKNISGALGKLFREKPKASFQELMRAALVVLGASTRADNAVDEVYEKTPDTLKTDLF